MNVVTKECEVELSSVTFEILSLTNNLKEKTKKNMMVGERYILDGIIIFEEIVKKLNPETMNDEVLNMIYTCVNIVLFRKEEQYQHVNNYVHYGINSCYSIIDMYNKSKKRSYSR